MELELEIPPNSSQFLHFLSLIFPILDQWQFKTQNSLLGGLKEIALGDASAIYLKTKKKDI